MDAKKEELNENQISLAKKEAEINEKNNESKTLIEEKRRLEKETEEVKLSIKKTERDKADKEKEVDEVKKEQTRIEKENNTLMDKLKKNDRLSEQLNKDIAYKRESESQNRTNKIDNEIGNRYNTYNSS